MDERVDVFARPDATKPGRMILGVAGILVSLGILGGAATYTFQQWAGIGGFLSGVFDRLGIFSVDCSKLNFEDEAIKACRD